MTRPTQPSWDFTLRLVRLGTSRWVWCTSSVDQLLCISSRTPFQKYSKVVAISRSNINRLSYRALGSGSPTTTWMYQARHKLQSILAAVSFRNRRVPSGWLAQPVSLDSQMDIAHRWTEFLDPSITLSFHSRLWAFGFYFEFRNAQLNTMWSTNITLSALGIIIWVSFKQKVFVFILWYDTL